MCHHRNLHANGKRYQQRQHYLCRQLQPWNSRPHADGFWSGGLLGIGGAEFKFGNCGESCELCPYINPGWRIYRDSAIDLHRSSVESNMYTFGIFCGTRRVLCCHGEGDRHNDGSVSRVTLPFQQVPLSGIPFFHVLDDWPRAGSHSHADVSKKAASGGDNRDKCSCVGIDLLRRWEFRGRRRRIDSRYSAGHLQSDRIRNERELDAYHHDRSHRENLTPQNTCCHETGQTDSSLGLPSIEWCITVLRSGIRSSDASEQIHCTNYVLRVFPESPDME